MVNNLRRRAKFEAFQTEKSKAIKYAKKGKHKKYRKFLDGNKQYFDFFCIFATKT